MTLSLRLAEAGLNVTLLESSKDLGGMASSCRIGDYAWDRFYHVILTSDSHLLELVDQLYLKDELVWGVTKTGFYADGRLYSISNSIEYLLFPRLNILDKFRLAWTIVYASRIKNWERLEKITTVDWLMRHSGRHTFEKLWLPLLKSKLGPNYSFASASFIWAHIARLYAARRSGLKKEMFGYIRGGYRTLIDRLQRMLEEKDVRILRETRAIKVWDGGPGVTIEIGRGAPIRVDKVLLTVPCTQIPELCPQLTPQEKTRLHGVVYQDLICAALILKKKLSNFYITNLADDSLPFTGIIEMTALVDRKNFGNHTLVYLPQYLAKGDPIFDKSDEEIRSAFFAGLNKIYPDLTNNDVVASHISRIRDFPIIPTLNYSTHAAPPIATSKKNVFIVNSAQILKGTINVNEIVELANSRVTELMRVLI
jgi:protoporphyrinogen oxidase